MKKLWYLLLIYFRPSAFVNACVKRRGYEEKEEIENVKEQESKRTKEIRKSHVKSFLTVLVVSLLGFFLAEYVNSCFAFSLFQIRVFRLISVVVVAWAVLSKLSWEIQSWGGESLPEQVNNYSFRLFYSLGIFMAVVSLFLEPEVV